MSRILIAQDDPAIPCGLKDNLEFESHQVLTAADGSAYAWMSRLRIPRIVAQGISGRLARNSSEIRVAASPTISISFTSESGSMRSLRRSSTVRPFANAMASPSASSMCRTRMRSAAFILGHSGRNHLVTKIPAQVLGSPHVDFAAKPLGEFDFHSRQSQKSRNVFGIEFHQHIDIALGPESRRKNGAEQGKFSNMVPLAKLLQELFLVRSAGGANS